MKESTYFEVAAFVATAFKVALQCISKYCTTGMHMSPFEVTYQRYALGLPIILVIQAFRSPATAKDSSVWGMTQTQFPYIMMRGLGSVLANTMLTASFQYVAASKALLVYENSFVPGMLAYILVGEPITKKELLIYFLSTIGLFMMSH